MNIRAGSRVWVKGDVISACGEEFYEIKGPIAGVVLSVTDEFQGKVRYDDLQDGGEYLADLSQFKPRSGPVFVSRSGGA
jgi:hypothetical protein